MQQTILHQALATSDHIFQVRFIRGELATVASSAALAKPMTTAAYQKQQSSTLTKRLKGPENVLISSAIYRINHLTTMTNANNRATKSMMIHSQRLLVRAQCWHTLPIV